jgi:hypothetical protein
MHCKKIWSSFKTCTAQNSLRKQRNECSNLFASRIQTVIPVENVKQCSQQASDPRSRQQPRRSEQTANEQAMQGKNRIDIKIHWFKSALQTQRPSVNNLSQSWAFIIDA